MVIYLLPFWKFRNSFKTNKKKTPKAKKNFIQTDNIPIVFLSTWLILQGVFYGENEKMRKYAESTD